mmetsp:Transcript_46484/g.55905  ORF Transcript_46484/g.55905 Transcript_46484/m.55905 type:complete len:245 (-) Transcript_46484:397-1131(-)|eukprot:CAMPEP_0194391924 /NCGR_PEP_ID=MMETSP0174-20130528/118605_1 /TAXON_ID=216777 /ORGANISM="Proboscia alata, Strain PI-D3" /LENGTH=244 /DNA_ID=CAMNT_0039186773 /DNA_START=125 /DNA_END=859 /DNA_ORIENTATION=+
MSYWLNFILQRWSPPQDVWAFVMLLMLAKRNEGRTVGTDAAKCDVNDAIGTDADESDLGDGNAKQIVDLPAEILELIGWQLIPQTARNGTWNAVDIPEGMRGCCRMQGCCLEAWEQKVGKQPLASLFQPDDEDEEGHTDRLGCVHDGLPAGTRLDEDYAYLQDNIETEWEDGAAYHCSLDELLAEDWDALTSHTAPEGDDGNGVPHRLTRREVVGSAALLQLQELAAFAQPTRNFRLLILDDPC